MLNPPPWWPPLPPPKGLPVGVTQKYLVVTCNYAARSAGAQEPNRKTGGGGGGGGDRDEE